MRKTWGVFVSAAAFDRGGKCMEMLMIRRLFAMNIQKPMKRFTPFCVIVYLAFGMCENASCMVAVVVAPRWHRVT